MKEVEADFKKILEEDIRGLFSTKSDLYLKAAYNFGLVDKNLQPSNETGGKMFRPFLLLSLNKALGGDTRSALPAATSIQIFHNFSLVHDDIEDNDSLRRGRPTAWSLWGIPQGINIGDFIFNLAIKSSLRVEEKILKPVLSELNKTYEAIVSGQQLDMLFEEKNISEVSEKDYLEMIEGKSAALVASSTFLGAFFADADQTILEKAHNFGLYLGMAYQIYDDYMGLWGKEEKTGKITRADILKKKKTYPIIIGHKKSSQSEKACLDNIFSKEKISSEDQETVINILERTRTNEETMIVFQRFQKKSLENLAVLNLSEDWTAYFKNIIEDLMRTK